MLNEFLLLAVAHLFAVASPGADFAVVLKNTLRSGQKTGTFTALGIGLGIFVHVAYTLLGVAIILSQSAFLFELVKYLGAGYLIWLAANCFRSRAKSSSTQVENKVESLSNLKAVKQGFLINVLNPKVTVFFIALFTSIVSQQTALWIQSIYGIWLALYTFIWFSFVAWCFSRAKVLAWYQSNGHIIDWLMGLLLVFIAWRMLV